MSSEDHAPTGVPVDVPVDVLVIGAGFAGLCAAVELDRAGERDVVVIERGPDVGGTWRDNTYPGAACDVASQLYSFSFAPHDWSRSFSFQPEIQEYLQRVARESRLLDRFVFDTGVDAAVWDDAQQRWVVTTTGPTGSRTYAARVVVSGAGNLSTPKLPDIAGIASFEGELFHSAQWRHDVPLEGKRIAVIGTGASAIQIVPELQKVAGRLDVYQRTAPHVIPRNDRTYPRAERWALRHVPGLQKAYREVICWAREGLVPGFTVSKRFAFPVKQIAAANRRVGVSDPELRRRVTPTFDIGCKRILISNDWYPALDSPHVDLVTDRIERVTPSGIVTADGTEREVDVIVVATGFQTTDQPIARHVTGRDGVTLADHWRDGGMSAYKGTTVHGFPNLFLMVGPNTALGHSSMVLIIEAQVGYAVDAVRTMRAHEYGTVEVTAEAERSWTARLRRRLRHTVWNTGGCSSWYLDEHGHNTLVWPHTTATFRRRLARFDVAAYDTAPPAVPAVPGSTPETLEVPA